MEDNVYEAQEEELKVSKTNKEIKFEELNLKFKKSQKKLAIVAFLEKSLPIISVYGELIETIYEKFSDIFDLKDIFNKKT